MEAVIFTKQAKQNLITEILNVRNTETGGILCGYYRDSVLVVESASGPGPHASHQVDEFVVDKNYMHQFLDQQYVESLGNNIYLGEWHTHPQRIPTPSEQDLKSIYERTLEWKHGEIVFLIIGFVGFTASSILEQSFALFYNPKKDKFYQVNVEFQ
jgi:integrative and conjugative element protein (TIGR02256 family)